MSFILPAVILVTWSYLLIKLRAFFILHPVKVFKTAFQGGRTLDALRALMLALSGTLGVGNIIGVCVGIEIGGAGSVFWLVISAFFSAMIKYAEVTLSARTGENFGTIAVIKSSFRHGKALSYAYAAIALLLSLAMGAAMQSSAIRQSAIGVGIKNMLPLTAALMLFLLVSLIFGEGFIKSAVTFIIPIASVLYMGMCFAVIIPNISGMPEALSDILRGAFTSGDAARGGIIGFITSKAISEGFARGLLSNEAGAGTSGFSHTALPPKDAARAGIFGIFEVLFDTLFLCLLTALSVILGRGASSSHGMLGLSEIFAAHIGRGAPMLLLFEVIAFAISTVICWFYYGSVCNEYIFGGTRYKNAARRVFPPVFFAVFTVGAMLNVPFLIPLNDALLLLLTLLSSSSVIKNSDRVLSLSEDMGLIPSKKSKK